MMRKRERDNSLSHILVNQIQNLSHLSFILVQFTILWKIDQKHQMQKALKNAHKPKITFFITFYLISSDLNQKFWTYL